MKVRAVEPPASGSGSDVFSARTICLPLRHTLWHLATILTGRNLPRIRQSGEAEPSTIDDTIADFTRVVDQDGKRCFPRDEIITDTKKAKPKKARRQLPSTHASVREFLNAGTISK